MALEIERKFLVDGDFLPEATRSVRIAQGYLCSTPERTVRIRIRDGRGVITFKGVGSRSGMTRFEWEHEIPLAEAQELLARCELGAIEKRRYLVPAGDHTFEVDVFGGDNEGLVVAEVELRSEDEPFERPAWLGREVTGDVRYYNAMLSKNPYKNWK